MYKDKQVINMKRWKIQTICLNKKMMHLKQRIKNYVKVLDETPKGPEKNYYASIISNRKKTLKKLETEYEQGMMISRKED